MSAANLSTFSPEALLHAGGFIAASLQSLEAARTAVAPVAAPDRASLFSAPLAPTSSVASPKNDVARVQPAPAADSDSLMAALRIATDSVPDASAALKRALELLSSEIETRNQTVEQHAMGCIMGGAVGGT